MVCRPRVCKQIDVCLIASEVRCIIRELTIKKSEEELLVSAERATGKMPIVASIVRLILRDLLNPHPNAVLIHPLKHLLLRDRLVVLPAFEHLVELGEADLFLLHARRVAKRVRPLLCTRALRTLLSHITVECRIVGSICIPERRDRRTFPDRRGCNTLRFRLLRRFTCHARNRLLGRRSIPTPRSDKFNTSGNGEWRRQKPTQEGVNRDRRRIKRLTSRNARSDIRGCASSSSESDGRRNTCRLRRKRRAGIKEARDYAFAELANNSIHRTRDASLLRRVPECFIHEVRISQRQTHGHGIGEVYSLLSEVVLES